MRCANCGAHVTEAYARVFSPDDGQPEVCPHCPNHCRDRYGHPRKVRHPTPTTGVSD